MQSTVYIFALRYSGLYLPDIPVSAWLFLGTAGVSTAIQLFHISQILYLAQLNICKSYPN